MSRLTAVSRRVGRTRSSVSALPAPRGFEPAPAVTATTQSKILSHQRNWSAASRTSRRSARRGSASRSRFSDARCTAACACAARSATAPADLRHRPSRQEAHLQVRVPREGKHRSLPCTVVFTCNAAARAGCRRPASGSRRSAGGAPVCVSPAPRSRSDWCAEAGRRALGGPPGRLRQGGRARLLGSRCRRRRAAAGVRRAAKRVVTLKKEAGSPDDSFNTRDGMSFKSRAGKSFKSRAGDGMSFKSRVGDGMSFRSTRTDVLPSEDGEDGGGGNEELAAAVVVQQAVRPQC